MAIKKKEVGRELTRLTSYWGTEVRRYGRSSKTIVVALHRRVTVPRI